jgi:hypothetical protein
MIFHGSRSTWGPGPSRSGLRFKNIFVLTKSDLSYKLHFVICLLNITVDAVDAHKTLFKATLTLGTKYLAYILAQVTLATHLMYGLGSLTREHISTTHLLLQNHLLIV